MNAFHMKCLRHIVNIKWTDKVTNNDILEQATRHQRLRWLGHVTRMDNRRITKQIIFGQLTEGTRRRGRTQIRYKDILKRDLEADINPDVYTDIAENRPEW